MQKSKINEGHCLWIVNTLALMVLGACGPEPQGGGGESTPGLSEEDREQLGEGLGGGNEPTEYGAVIDSFCGIEARQNGPDPSWTPGFEATYGFEYQCTELAFRFICQHFNLCTSKDGKFGNAKFWYDNTENNPVLAMLTPYPNGGSEPPRPGDVLVSDGGFAGHVAIVKWIDDDYVYVLEQNAYQGAHNYAISENNGTYTMGAQWIGWMRAPGGPANCEPGPSDCGCGGTLDVVSVVDGKLLVSGMLHCPDGIEKWSIAVHEDVVYTGFPTDETSVSFSELIDISGYDFPSPSAVGLWAKPLGDDSCLLDDETIELPEQTCEATENTQCIDETVVYVDSCGEVSGIKEVCDGACVEISPVSAECEGLCGNGALDASEECDGLQLGGETCVTRGFEGGALACYPGCTYDTSGCTINQMLCGNGAIDNGEQCDGVDLGGASCVSLGFSGGVLGCSDCGYDTDGCTNQPMCTYDVSPKYPNSSYDAPYSCPGGVVMPVAGALDNNGNLTVSSPGKPGGYGAGTYRVLVFDPNDPVGDQCKPWNVVKSTAMLNGTQNSIVFPEFNSSLMCSDQKAYCVVKEDGGTIAHFCSGKLVASYN
jgi:surface antigen